MLICSICKKEKAEIDFSKDKSKPRGFQYRCKACSSHYKKERYAGSSAVREECKRYIRQYRNKNKERVKQYHIENRERSNKRSKQWNSENKDRIKRWRIKNKDKINHRERIKYHTVPAYKLYKCISRNINYSLKGNKNNRAWESLVKYDLGTLKDHLEKQFKDGMSWGNYGKWHIDHIVPVSVFNFRSDNDIDFERCWSLNNLRPLWAKDNLSKGNKLLNPLQPSISFG